MRDYAFGNFLFSLREKKGYTQAYVAKVLNVTPAAVSKWENGESKPRVDVLFKLASLLEVRAEELIEGRYIEQKTLDEKAVRAISMRYEYLRRMDSFEKPSVKFKRMLAFLIDWNIIGHIILLLLLVEVTILRKNGLLESSEALQPFAPIFAITMLLFPVVVVFRDFMFGGKSLGKRILKLVILDVDTAIKPKLGKTIVRGLFLFLLPIDGIVLLTSGKSIGDYIARTVVVNKKDIGEDIKTIDFIYESGVDSYLCDARVDSATIDEINSYAPKTNSTALYIVLSIVGILMFVAFLYCISLCEFEVFVS